MPELFYLSSFFCVISFDGFFCFSSNSFLTNAIDDFILDLDLALIMFVKSANYFNIKIFYQNNSFFLKSAKMGQNKISDNLNHRFSLIYLLKYFFAF